ncbi:MULTISPECIES: SMI1/KNR4 family protein [Pseudomonas]|nr:MULTISPECIES: SMI1/KNR4 family protein [Pseudomonas]MBV4508207.1 SMI1/KNR4 family protein [Pseudomonas peradeniyensis]
MGGDKLLEYLCGAERSFVKCMGYSEPELDKIARLYDIRIEGQLQLFLSRMGKCAVGLIGDSQVQLYRTSWTVREHLLFQVDFFSQMQEAGHYGFLNNPFVFSLVSETQYYFLQTSLSDAVYHYDSNTDVVTETDADLFAFLKLLADENRGVLKVFTCGDLLRII